MKKLNAYLLVVLLSVIGFACKEDPLESITIKTSGTLSVTLMNGNQPLANQKVWFESSISGFEDVLLTDANGRIDFGPLNAGSYVLYTEVDEPYTEVHQEIHVISGENIHKELQVKNYVGIFKFSLRDNWNSNIINEDLGFKILFVPLNDAFYEATSYASITDVMYELAAKEVTLGDKGILTVELPVAKYNIYLVKNDIIERTYHSAWINKFEDNSGSIYINPDSYRD